MCACSGIHCELTNKGGGEVWLKDLSTNGTFVNGVAVGKNKSQLLHDGVEIVLIKSATEKIGYKLVFTDSDKKELNQAEQKYKLLDTLGSGAFAQVRKCIDKQTGQHSRLFEAVRMRSRLRLRVRSALRVGERGARVCTLRLRSRATSTVALEHR